MNIISRRKVLKDNLTQGIKRYMTMNLAFIVLLVMVRIFEYFYLNQAMTLPKEALKLELFGVGHDLLMLFNLATFLIIPFLILNLLYKPLASFVFGIFIIGIILTEGALIMYFGATSLLLGTDLFGYTFDEIVKIASAGGGLSIVNLILIFAGTVLMAAILILSKLFRPSGRVALIFLILICGSLLFKKYTKPQEGDFKSEFALNIITNKTYHILSATYQLIYPEEKNEASLYNYFYTGLLPSGMPFEYVSSDFPFLRKNDTPDVLGKYFNIGTSRPNLVFIIVESLGRAYCGEGAYLKSFTPFLDSLENHSLYWENMLSTASRTFELLPSVFGSMPFAKNGFAELGNDMPDGLSLINLLKDRGYVSRFFYGGNANFDNMRLFLKKQNIDYVIDEKDFGPGYSKMPSDSHNFTWGYSDKEIFRKGFENLSKADSTPRLDIYLTITMHDPFLIPDQDYYDKKVEERLSFYKFDNDEKAEYRKYIRNFATILYFDDALRYFLEEYKKREDFKNTIFFITGDHRMSSPPISTQIDRYHVPLVIYSTMLKTPAKFSSVVSHLDITPSVVAFLKNNYGMKFPLVVPWLGQGLDSVKTFRNTSSIPFIRTKLETIDYIDKEYFIVKNQLFRVSENLSLVEIEDNKKLSEIQRKFEKFKIDNIKACFNNKLIPDSLILKK